MKALKAALLLLVVLGVIAASAASLWAGRGVKAAIERFGPGILDTTVTVSAVVVAPWSGRGTITNLAIGNPPGFKSAQSLNVGSIDVKIDLPSLLTDTVVIESIVVREPEIFYEMSGGGSNLSRLQKNAQRGKDTDKKAKTSVTIKKLLVTGGKVGLSTSIIGHQSMKIPLPAIEMSNLGGQGRSPAEAAAEVLGELSNSAGKAAAGAGTKAVSVAASSVMGKVGGLFKGKKK